MTERPGGRQRMLVALKLFSHHIGYELISLPMPYKAEQRPCLPRSQADWILKPLIPEWFPNSVALVDCTEATNEEVDR